IFRANRKYLSVYLGQTPVCGGPGGAFFKKLPREKIRAKNLFPGRLMRPFSPERGDILFGHNGRESEGWGK
ncbi:MAG: hypothetical protein IKR53_01380, partial [Clostridia bacterium]|nr:hypothetical protein [Clostridia bacterium]